MQKFSFIFQSFFKLLLIFLLVFVWVRYFVKSLVKSIIISSVVTLVIEIISQFFFKKHTQKINLKAKEKEDAEYMFTSLAIDNNYMSFFENLFSDKTELKKNKKYLAYTENNAKTMIFPMLTFSELSINDIAQAMKQIKKEKPQKVIFLTGSISKESQTFIKIYDTEIILLDKYQTYAEIYKKNNIFPKINFTKQKQSKLTLRQLLEFSFNKARFKGYVFSALALLFCSLFVRASLYYAIVTSILLLFAILSLINPFERRETKHNKKTTLFQGHKDNQALQKNILQE